MMKSRAVIRFGAAHNEIVVRDKDRIETIPLPHGGKNKAEREHNNRLLTDIAASLCEHLGIRERKTRTRNRQRHQHLQQKAA